MPTTRTPNSADRRALRPEGRAAGRTADEPHHRLPAARHAEAGGHGAGDNMRLGPGGTLIVLQRCADRWRHGRPPNSELLSARLYGSLRRLLRRGRLRLTAPLRCCIQSREVRTALAPFRQRRSQSWPWARPRRLQRRIASARARLYGNARGVRSEDQAHDFASGGTWQGRFRGDEERSAGSAARASSSDRRYCLNVAPAKARSELSARPGRALTVQRSVRTTAAA